jgi:hypothetical protein
MLSIPCSNCGGAGLELQTENLAVCKFCGAQNRIVGVVCPRCERVNPRGAAACEACGRGLVRVCPDCHADDWSGATECRQCGRHLDTLEVLIQRWGSGTEGRLDEQQRSAVAIKAEEERASQKRLAAMQEQDRHRQAALSQAARRRDAQQRVLMTIAFIMLVAFAAVLVIGGVLSAILR